MVSCVSTPASVQPSLHDAVIRLDLMLAKTLLKQGADPNGFNSKGQAPLHALIVDVPSSHCRTKVAMLKLLMRYGADIHAPSQHSNYSPLTPLHLAVAREKAPLVKALLRHGADVHCTTTTGLTPLSLCLMNITKPSVVQELLKHGADPNMNVNAHFNAFHHLFVIFGHTHPNHFPVVRLFVEHGADLEAKDGLKSYTGLLWALHSQNKKAVEFLLRRGSKTDVTDALGNTPFHVMADAFRSMDSHVFQQLLDHGADPAAINHRGESPLFVAVRKQKASFVRPLLKYHLLKYHFPFEQRNHQGETLMDLARDLNIVTLLQEAQIQWDRLHLMPSSLLDSTSCTPKKRL